MELFSRNSLICSFVLFLLFQFVQVCEAKPGSMELAKQEIVTQLNRYNRLIKGDKKKYDALLELSLQLAKGYLAVSDFSNSENFLHNAFELSRYSAKEQSWKFHIYCQLARLKKQLGNPREAEIFVDNAVAIAEQAGSRRKQDGNWGVVSLIKADVSYQLQKTNFSKKYYKEALAAFEKSPTRFCSGIFQAHQGLGLNHLGNDDNDLAIQSFQLSIEKADSYDCMDSEKRSTALNNLGLAYYSKGELEKAIKYLENALELKEKRGGINTVSAIKTRHNLAELYRKSGYGEKTLKSSEKYFAAVSSQFEKQLLERGESFAKDYSRGSQSRSVRSGFGTLAQAGNSSPSSLFSAYQLVKLNSTNIAYSAMLKTSVNKHDEIAPLVSQRKKILSSLEYRKDSNTLDSDSRFSFMLGELAENKRKINAIDPSFFSIYLHDQVSLKQLQSVLGADEAVVAFLVDTDIIYAFVIGNKKVSFKQLKINYRKLKEQIAHIRERLDPRNLGMYPAKIGYSLYQQLVDPLDIQKGVSKLLVVSDGILDQLPLSALITDQPPESRLSLRRLDWIVDQYAVSYFPSVSVLYHLRTRSGPTAADLAFFGIANPRFNDLDQEYRAISVNKIYNPEQKITLPVFRYISNLPETQQEIEDIAALFPGGRSHIYTGDRANEQVLKSLDLSRFKYLVFATHGLVAGDFDGLAEPALLLTPPTKISGQNDGVLKASEVSGLQLNADLAVLSACNTASPDGENGAEGLSGLAKSFLYAGSRAVLVSHWPVNSVATVETTTSFFRILTQSEGRRKAVALQKAKIQLKNKYPNPSYWAPFILIGE